MRWDAKRLLALHWALAVYYNTLKIYTSELRSISEQSKLYCRFDTQTKETQETKKTKETKISACRGTPDFGSIHFQPTVLTTFIFTTPPPPPPPSTLPPHY
jgi:hypothetical protein